MTTTNEAKRWSVAGAVKDRQSITSDWEFTQQKLIDGVSVREVKNVPKENGALTEIFRADWALPGGNLVGQAFQVTLFPGLASAWHAHAITTDRLFVNSGMIRIVLFDAREESPTFGLVNEFRFGDIRPALVVVPPRVFHGVINLASEPSSVLNLVDHPYQYEDPDHWRLPPDSRQIPCCIWHGKQCPGHAS